ncbi:MAG: hypothetical protein ACT4P7_14070 [Gemmatimonadaceae bacterium]
MIDTWEIDRADRALRHVASQLSLTFHAWARSKGIRRRPEAGARLIDDTALPSDALRHVEREGSGVFHFPLLGHFVEDPVVVSCLHEAADRFRNRRGSIVISGREIRMPESLRQHAIVVRLPARTIDEYRALLERVVREHTARMPVRADLTNETRSRLLHNL